jgi:hypothetical protein
MPPHRSPGAHDRAHRPSRRKRPGTRVVSGLFPSHPFLTPIATARNHPAPAAIPVPRSISHPPPAWIFGSGRRVHVAIRISPAVSPGPPRRERRADTRAGPAGRSSSPAAAAPPGDGTDTERAIHPLGRRGEARGRGVRAGASTPVPTHRPIRAGGGSRILHARPTPPSGNAFQEHPADPCRPRGRTARAARRAPRNPGPGR